MLRAFLIAMEPSLPKTAELEGWVCDRIAVLDRKQALLEAGVYVRHR